jgi:hypothetical protein
MLRVRPILCLFAGLLYLAAVRSTLAAGEDVAPLFAESSPLALTLTGPFARIDEERVRGEAYRGSVTWDEGGATRTLEVKFEARGHFRRSEDICDHVPIWLDLDKDEVDGTLFAGQNRLKLVLQCRDTPAYAEYIAREHQVYRMFNLLSDVSLKSRMLRVTLRDSDTGEERTQRALVLQHHKRLAEQLDLEVLEQDQILRATLDPQQSNLVALFMMMVANTDFSMAAGKPGEGCCHNTKPLINADGVVFPVPYDFDSVGYVNAIYAQVAAGLGQDDVRDRVYRGYCAHNDMMDTNMDLLRQHKDALLAIAADDSYVSERTARDSVRFIEGFYKLIDSKRRRKFMIERRCLG